MPYVVRLPGHVQDDELRVYWDRTDDGDDLHVWGPRRMQRFALDIFTSKRLALNDDLLNSYTARTSGMVRDEPSYLDELEEAGYDPKTLVFSIRKKDTPKPQVDVPDDILKRLEDAQTALLRAAESLRNATETKSVYILDEDEHHDLVEAIDDASTAVIKALNKAGER